MTLFRSEALFLLLSNFTGLRLHFLAPSEEGGMEDTKEDEAASAPDSTDEGTSCSSSEPQESQAAISSSSQRGSERTNPEPEENEAEKGKLRLRLVPVSITHSPLGHLLHEYFSSTYCLLGPAPGAVERNRRGPCCP